MGVFGKKSDLSKFPVDQCGVGWANPGEFHRWSDVDIDCFVGDGCESPIVRELRGKDERERRAQQIADREKYDDQELRAHF